MESNSGHDEQAEPTDPDGIFLGFAELPPATILTISGMAKLFGKSPNTIMRAVAEGRLPKPFRIFSENCWRAGDVDVFLHQRMRDAQQRTGEQPRHGEAEVPSRQLTPLKRGDSPLRLEPHARNP